jgi:hypothetical protein
MFDAKSAELADPYIFAVGFIFLCGGLMLSQVHRDEGVILRMSIGLPFNLLRNVSAVGVIVALVLGFWVIGGWWALIAPLIVIVAAIPVQLLRSSERRLSAIFVLMCLGLAAVTWAQVPTVNRLGLMPSSIRSSS